MKDYHAWFLPLICLILIPGMGFSNDCFELRGYSPLGSFDYAIPHQSQYILAQNDFLMSADFDDTDALNVHSSLFIDGLGVGGDFFNDTMVFAYHSFVHFVDVSKMNNILLKSSVPINLDPNESLNKLHVSGSTLVLVTSFGIRTYRIHDYWNVEPIAYLEGYYYRDACLSGSYLYVITHNSFYIYSHAGNGTPVFISEIADIFWNGLSISIYDDHAFITEELTIINVADPINPYIVRQYDLRSRQNNLAFKDHYCYVFSEYDPNAILIFDLTDPSFLWYYTYDLPSSGESYGKYLFSSEDKLVILDEKKIEVLDISDPIQPDYLYMHQKSITETSIFRKNGNYLYVADGGHIAVFDVTNPLQPVIVNHVLVGLYIHEIKLDGDYLLVSDEYYSLVILDISIPYSPEIISRWYPTPMDYHAGVDFDIEGDLLYELVLGPGVVLLYIIDISDMHNPREVTMISQESLGTYEIEVIQNNAYISTKGRTVLSTWDFSDLHDPILIDEIATFSKNLQEYDNDLFLIADEPTGGLDIRQYEHVNQAPPVVLSEVWLGDLYWPTYYLTKQYLYVAALNGIAIVEKDIIMDPSILDKQYFDIVGPTEIILIGQYLYVEIDIANILIYSLPCLDLRSHDRPCHRPG